MKRWIVALATLAIGGAYTVASPAQTGAETLLSRGKPVTASSVEADGYAASAAVDGDPTTRWASAEGADPQWISIDLGATATISRVELNWETAYAKAYRIETSADGTAWTSVYATSTGNGGTDTITGLNPQARHIRMYGTQRATSWGYSLWAFDVYGTGEGGGEPVTIDLLAGRDWSRFAGASVQPDGIRIVPLDRRLVDQDGTGGQPNPPVNMRGPRLDAPDDFRVTAVMDGVGSKGAYLQLYATVPIIYDEWRQEPASLRLGIKGGKLQVSVWDGKSDQAKTTKSFGSGLAGRVTVEARSIGATFHLYVNDSKVGTVADPGVFGGTVWFGADAEVGGGWTLASLTAQAESGHSLQVLDPPPLAQPPLADSLRGRAAALARPIAIGAALAAGPLFADGGYRALAGGQLSILTPENDLKPQFLQPRPGVFAFAEGDALVDFARANDMKVHAHTLVWHEALPAWMRADATQDTMFAHIDAVAGHYRGKVVSWDVINEPMSDEDADYTNGNKGLRSDSPWFESMGEQYIDLAFHRARQADPGAKLFLNEYGVEEEGDRWEALFALVKRLKQRGVPIDGIGFQNHEYAPADRIPPPIFRSHVRKLAALGLEVRVSEMDVLIDGNDERDVQAEEFAGKLEVCRSEPNCHSFSSWGFTDRYGSTADTHHYPPTPGDALPWDAALRPKAAYTAMLNELG